MRKYLLIFEVSLIDESDGLSCGTLSQERQIECEANELSEHLARTKARMEATAIRGTRPGFYSTVSLKQVLPL